MVKRKGNGENVEPSFFINLIKEAVSNSGAITLTEWMGVICGIGNPRNGGK